MTGREGAQLGHWIADVCADVCADEQCGLAGLATGLIPDPDACCADGSS
ncbi:hypothetical protein [Kitasatospora sp. NBC_00315]